MNLDMVVEKCSSFFNAIKPRCSCFANLASKLLVFFSVVVGEMAKRISICLPTRDSLFLKANECTEVPLYVAKMMSNQLYSVNPS